MKLMTIFSLYPYSVLTVSRDHAPEDYLTRKNLIYIKCSSIMLLLKFYKVADIFFKKDIQHSKLG